MFDSTLRNHIKNIEKNELPLVIKHISELHANTGRFL